MVKEWIKTDSIIKVGSCQLLHINEFPELINQGFGGKNKGKPEFTLTNP